MSDFAQNKRRAERLVFTSRCSVEVETPAWAMMTEPMPGETSNITQHGMRISLRDFLPMRAQKWGKAVDSHERLIVRVNIPLEPTPLTLSGQVVWFEFEETDIPGEGIANLGILFAVLREGESRLLRRLLESIDTQDGT
jgi:hypothetical protein